MGMRISGRFEGLRRLGGVLLDAALPPHCLTCEERVSAQGTQCLACFGRLHFIAEPVCEGCGTALPYAGARWWLGLLWWRRAGWGCWRGGGCC